MKVKGLFLLIVTCVLFSCTSNTIYEKPKDLITKDTMVSLLKDLYLASAAKNVTNKQAQRRFSYVPLVYDKYKIDSARFQRSNLYYISLVDVYEPMLEEVFSTLEAERTILARQKKVRDSLRQDSLRRVKRKITDTKRRPLTIDTTSVNKKRKKTVKKKD